MAQITAQLNYLRISPRKVRAVAELLKGLDVDAAQAQLKYIVRRPAKPILKLLNSAVSNAKHNLGLDADYLYIKEITVNEGMKLKRYKPKGFGLAMAIQKKTSHIRIILDELTESKRKKKEERLIKMPKPLEVKKEKIEEKKEIEPSLSTPPKQLRLRRPGAKVSEGKGKKEVKVEQKQKTGKPRKEIEKVSKKGVFGGIKTLGRRLFRRKSI